MTTNDSIIIYQTPDGKSTIEVSLKEDTIWLNHIQIANLFERERSVITKHINKVFKDEELDEKSNVQKMHIANSDKPIKFYNLDVIISVGYRVNSNRGTQFRIWATTVLKDHLLKGYTLNEKRLLVQKEKIKMLTNAIQLIEQTAINQPIDLDEAKALIKVISDYSYGLSMLDDYDHQRMTIRDQIVKPSYVLTFEESKRLIDKMKGQVDSNLFGAEKDESFKGSIGAIDRKSTRLNSSH